MIQHALQRIRALEDQMAESKKQYDRIEKKLDELLERLAQPAATPRKMSGAKPRSRKKTGPSAKG